MDDVEIASWASAVANERFICVETYSGLRRVGRDPLGKQHLLELDTSDDVLGNALLDALAHSRFLTVDEAATFLDLTRVTDDYSEWVSNLKQQYGFKSKRALFRNMRCCDIRCKDSSIRIRPTNHEKLESWSGDGISETNVVYTSTSGSPEEIGAALRLAFSRCIDL